MSTLDHISLNVSDYGRAKAFFTKALAPLGIKPLMEFGTACGFGAAAGKPDFWIGAGHTSFQTPEQVRILTPIHVAFSAKSRADVDAFYRAAIEAGGRDFGPPGLRTQYHPNYYGAFVLDADGHNIEAVFHTT